jgi:hypothetical protein
LIEHDKELKPSCDKERGRVEKEREKEWGSGRG